MKNVKKVLAVLMAVAMLFALSSTAFADTDITVTISLQTADAPVGGYGVFDDYTNVYPIVSNLVVQVPVGSTVKDVVNKVIEYYFYESIVDCSYEHIDGMGCVHTWNATLGASVCADCGLDCDCTWVRVENTYYDSTTGHYVGNGTYSSVLNSIVYGIDEYINENRYIYNLDGTTTYEGHSWEYFVDKNLTNDDEFTYPEPEYMNQFILNDGAEIILSYDFVSFTY